jgi:hypothetical protein
MMSKYTLLLAVLTISLLACKPKVTEDPLTETPVANTDSIDNQSYRIVSDTLDAAGNLVIDVKLTKQEDSLGLRYLAAIISDQKEDSLSAIRFFHPGNALDSPYATVHFIPDIKLTINK